MGQSKSNESTFSHELHFRAMMDQMLEGVQIISHEWKYIYVNEALVKQGGYSWEQLKRSYDDGNVSRFGANGSVCIVTRVHDPTGK